MPTISDETYYRYLGASVPRFVVRGCGRSGAVVCQTFATRAAAERFRDATWPRRSGRVEGRRAADFAGDVKNILASGTRIHFSAGRTYLGSVRSMEGGYGIQFAGLGHPVLVHSWAKVAAFIAPATRASDRNP